MPAKSQHLHGSAPDRSLIALLMIDVINDFEFPEGDQLLQFAMPMARSLAKLKQRARADGIPVVYVNDNFGRWRSDFNTQVEHCLQPDIQGRPFVELLQPEEDDYFVLKPKHSGFISTPLQILLNHLGVRVTILTGLASNICVLFTANDAYMRDYSLVVPGDCVAANTESENRNALEQIEKILKADIRPSHEICFDQLRERVRSSSSS